LKDFKKLGVFILSGEEYLTLWMCFYPFLLLPWSGTRQQPPDLLFRRGSAAGTASISCFQKPNSEFYKICLSKIFFTLGLISHAAKL
jgi:hypothetical protein